MIDMTPKQFHNRSHEAEHRTGWRGSFVFVAMKRSRWVELFCILLLCGCATTQQQVREMEIHRRLENTIVPEIRFKEAQPSCIIYYLQAISRTNKADAGINFVLIPPDITVSDGITIHAWNISILEALNIISKLGGLKWVIEDSVVKVMPDEKRLPTEHPANSRPLADR